MEALAPCVAADALRPVEAKRVMRSIQSERGLIMARTSVQSSAAAKWLSLPLVSFWAHKTLAAQRSPRHFCLVLGSFAAALGWLGGWRARELASALDSIRFCAACGTSPTEKDPRIAPPSPACTAAAKALALDMAQDWQGVRC
ncbi:hypothetical protein TrVFT333_006708 [Trichoderma virens FT-333]|nr:hypothetical protein TrVFT333_006708 [Trichoderma virens FT-333]